MRGHRTACPLSRDMTKTGWKLITDVAMLKEPSITRLRLLSFLEGDETCISGKKLCERAKGLKANHGQRLAEYFLRHPTETPSRPGQNVCLVFPGTTWFDPKSGYTYISVLYWLNGELVLDFRKLGDEFDGHNCLVRILLE